MIGWTELWPQGANLSNWSHSGIEFFDGKLVFGEPGGGALVFYDEQSQSAERVAAPTAVIHGISRSLIDPDVLVLADPGPDGCPGQVLEFSVCKRTFSVIDEPGVAGFERRGWRPTSTATVGSGATRGDLWIADGYGRSLVHRVRPDGPTHTFNGEESGIAFSCPHGIAVDTRLAEPQLIVADRSNRRLVFLDAEGRYIREIRSDVMTSPSSIAVRGRDLLVTDLFGALLRVDENDGVSAVIEQHRSHEGPHWPNAVDGDGQTVRPPLLDGVLNSPHGIVVGENGDAYLTEWLYGGRQLRLGAPYLD